MNNQEFELWFTEHSELFPSVAEWFRRMVVDGPDPKRVKTNWWKILARVEYRDAVDASRGIATGRFPAIPAFERDNIPAIIRGLANRLKDDRDGTGPEYDLEPVRPGPPTVMAKTLIAMMQMVHDGTPLDDAKAWGREQVYADGIEDSPRSAYKCRGCPDDGWVLVWHPRAHQNAIDGCLDSPRDRPTCVMACDQCAKGERHQANHESRYRDGKSITFSMYRHIPTTGRGDRHAIDELESWGERYRQWQAENFSAPEARLF